MLEPKNFLDFRSAGRLEEAPSQNNNMLYSPKSDPRSQLMIFSDSEIYSS